MSQKSNRPVRIAKLPSRLLNFPFRAEKRNDAGPRLRDILDTLACYFPRLVVTLSSV